MLRRYRFNFFNAQCDVIKDSRFPTHLDVIIMNFVSEPVSVRGESHNMSVGEISDDESLPGKRDIHRIGQSGRRVQGSEQVPEGRVDQDGAVYRENKSYLQKCIMIKIK